ncbi:VOC family protein [Robiginitalea sediminis]|uniref:VOC family protein n=1 Tax=Robiginitalea sediminis TaxID=1982593 RepID=UPI000B4C1ADC|nr:VOC family protein [Robiginitalea sediminis]
MENGNASNVYQVPDGTRIGHVHLKVSRLDRALAFYRDLLGFHITERYGEQAVFLASGDYHHHLALNTWQSLGAPPAPRNSAGLFHVAICYPKREDLARIYARLMAAGYPLTGAADHGVSEALYLDDPDGNGVELYWDRPRARWPRDPEGNLKMFTRSLDLEALAALAAEEP